MYDCYVASTQLLSFNFHIKATLLYTVYLLCFLTQSIMFQAIMFQAIMFQAPYFVIYDLLSFKFTAKYHCCSSVVPEQ